MAFAPGDIVTLKSGGHSMTVVAVSDEDVDCLWVADDGELFRQSIPAIALTVVELTEFDEADESSEDEETEAEEEGEDEAEADEDDDKDDAEEEDEDENTQKRRAKRR